MAGGGEIDGGSTTLHELTAGYNPIFKPHLPGFGHRFLSKLMGGGMFFWMMYRIRQVWAF